MLNSNIGEFAVLIGADTAKFDRGIKGAQAGLEGLEGGVLRSAASIGRVASGIGIAAAGIGAGLTVMASRAGDAAREIEQLSRVSNAGVVEFQKMAAASATFGIEQDKLADILKDMNDRIGDFVTTGGGPMADFFEKVAPLVGVTAQQFEQLSGPDALGLFVSSLEKAGLSAQEMTFHMEAIASDSTRLLPLLANNGAELNRLGDAAQRAGRIMSEDAVRGGAEMDRKMAELSSTIRDRVNVAMAENSDAIILVVDALSGLVGIAGSVVSGLADIGGAAASAAANFLSLSEAARDSYAEAMNALQAQQVAERNREVRKGQRNPAYPLSESGGTSLPYFGPRNTFELKYGFEGTGAGSEVFRHGYTPPALTVDDSSESPALVIGSPISPVASPRPPQRAPNDNDFGLPPPSTGGGGGGGGGYPGDDVLDQLRARFQDASDIAQEAYDRDMAALEEFRDAKRISLEEFNSLEEQLTAEHQEKLSQIEARAREARLSGYQGFLGDLAGIAAEEGDALFAVQKAGKLAQAGLNAVSAAVSAWEKGMAIGGPPVAAAFAGASLLRTGSMIAQMASMNSRSTGGGSVGGGGGGTASAPVAAPPAPLVVSLAEISPSGLFSGAALSDLFEGLSKEATRRGARGLVFQ